MFGLLLLSLCVCMQKASSDDCTDGECSAMSLMQSRLSILEGQPASQPATAAEATAQATALSQRRNVPIDATPAVHGSSSNLGNIIGQLLAPDPFQSHTHCDNSTMCFAQFLFDSMSNGSASWNSHTIPNKSCGCETHPLYCYGCVQPVLSQMADALRIMMQSYAKKFDANLIVPQSPTHCVVHFRLGDMANFTANYIGKASVVATRSIASAVASLRLRDGEPCHTVEILNGGMKHQGLDPADGRYKGDYDHVTKQEVSSKKQLRQLQNDIQSVLPDADVFVQTGGTADADFFKMASAPGFVFTQGSYAIAAAIAGGTNVVRSPAQWVDDPMENSPGFEWKSATGPAAIALPYTIRPGWITYPAELQEINVSEWTSKPQSMTKLG